MKKTILMLMCILSMLSCKKQSTSEFSYHVDQFYDLEVLRYQVPDFDSLTLQQQSLVYYLTEAALYGRDILYDQNGRYNLRIRRALEYVYENYANKDEEEFKKMELYLKRVWFSNGIHHHYSEDKFLPEFTEQWWRGALASTNYSLSDEVIEVMFNPNLLPKRTNQADGCDLVLTSAGNFYQGVNQAEAEAYYAAHKDTSDHPLWIGLNAQLVKENGEVRERTYKVGGLYGEALAKINENLRKALPYAENDKQREAIQMLIDYNETGDLSLFNAYCIAWVSDLESRVDFVNGFTETYSDPLGITATWESLVNFKNMEATRRTQKIADNAQWFEDNSPTAPEYKKKEVKGVSAKVINAAILAGDCYPATPIGINLPNANWIRKEYGSKSVTIDNITDAYNEAALGNGFNEEFMFSNEEVERARLYGAMTNSLHTDLHECVGHGSGQLLPGVSKDALREHASTIEEARADLFGLYYMGDEKMVELGLLPNMEAYKAEYYQQMMNGLMTQLVRIEPGKDIEEAHMRNRQLIARWVYERAQQANCMPQCIALVEKDGKTYLQINNYQQLRDLYGELLAYIQEITSTGNYEAAKELVENYAVKVDSSLHQEVLKRYESLHLAPYKGFVNPVYKAEFDADGNIKSVSIDYTEGYAEQHLRYSHQYSPLPDEN